MVWITKLKKRLGLTGPVAEPAPLKTKPEVVSFPPTCPLRPEMEPAEARNPAGYLKSQGNRPEIIERFNRILKMDTIILELGCGNAEIAWQIASQNANVGVVATDIYRSPCLAGSVSGYAKASRAWTNGLLKAQILAPVNLAILRAGACLLRFLPAESLDSLLMVNPEPAVGRAFLELLAETPVNRAVRPGSKQLVIKPFSKKMGIATCGGYEFETGADWSRGIGFIAKSPFEFKEDSTTQWKVNLGTFSDYSKNSTQTGVLVCGNIGSQVDVSEKLPLKAFPQGRPAHRPGSI